LPRPTGSDTKCAQEALSIRNTHNDYTQISINDEGEQLMGHKPKRRGVIKFLGNIVDDSKDIVDDVLDRARDVERDLRSAAHTAIHGNDDHDDDDDHYGAAADVGALQIALSELTEKVDQLAVLQRREPQQRLKREKEGAASAS
jgi:hypothetical protein